MDVNVKVAHKDISCKGEAITTSATAITFPNSGKTGDCLGDAVRGQKKDPSKCADARVDAIRYTRPHTC